MWYNVRNLVNKNVGSNSRSDVYTFVRAAQAQFDWTYPGNPTHHCVKVSIHVILPFDARSNFKTAGNDW